jgi:hypothetical protein
VEEAYESFLLVAVVAVVEFVRNGRVVENCSGKACRNIGEMGHGARSSERIGRKEMVHDFDIVVEMYSYWKSFYI